MGTHLHESAPRELSNEYQRDRVLLVSKELCVLVLWTKVASALEGLSIKQGKPTILLVLKIKEYSTFR